MEAVKAAEDAIRTERHDLRHRLQAVTELVSRGDKKSALEFLDAAQKRLDEHKEIRWCRPPVLDAVFSSCFDQAQNQGISVEAKLSPPSTLPVDEKMPFTQISRCPENSERSGARWWGRLVSCWNSRILVLPMSPLTATVFR